MDVMDAAISNHIGPVAAESEDTRWREWKRKGHDDDARFRRRLRTVVVDAAAIFALGGALWFGM